MSLFGIKRISRNEGYSVRVVLLYLFKIEFGIHETHGIHINLGIGVGAFEISVTLHHWRKNE